MIEEQQDDQEFNFAGNELDNVDEEDSEPIEELYS
jgi:hypothetical protein